MLAKMIKFSFKTTSCVTTYSQANLIAHSILQHTAGPSYFKCSPDTFVDSGWLHFTQTQLPITVNKLPLVSFCGLHSYISC